MNDIKGIVDISLALATCCYMVALVPQIVKIYKLKKANQLSLPFMGITAGAILLSVFATYLIECYMASIANGIQFVGYLILIIMKTRYNNDN